MRKTICSCSTSGGIVTCTAPNFFAEISLKYLNLSEKNYVSEETFCERISRLAPKPGDVLFSREGAILVRHFQENQVSQLLQIVAVGHTVVPQGVAHTPDFGNDGGGLVKHVILPLLIQNSGFVCW